MGPHMFRFPVLLGDVGGTNARFALLAGPDKAPLLLARERTADHGDPVSAIRAVLRAQGDVRPRSALLALATRVDAPVVRLTNAAWVFDGAAIARALDLDRLLLVNDFAPVAVSLAARDKFPAGSLVPIGAVMPGGAGPCLALGPGTGLGAAALLPLGERFLVQPTEAGHVEFGPSESDEFGLWPHLERAHGRITAETILSGPGLLRLYRALAHSRGAPPVLRSPPDIAAAGRDGGDSLAVETLHIFARLLGRFAGDMALIFGAIGGVFLTGGLAPALLPAIQLGGFRAAFERKAPFDALMRQVPSHVITHPEPALIGLAAMASAPERFITGAIQFARAGS